MNFTINSADEDITGQIAVLVAEALEPGDTVLLSGPVGSGKTFFTRRGIQHLLAGENRLEDVPSPTFTLVQTYELSNFDIWHADLYRLTSPEETDELGLEEAFSSSICFLEWPDRLGSAQPVNALRITFEVTKEDARNVHFAWSDEKWADKLTSVQRNLIPGGKPRDKLLTDFLHQAGWASSDRIHLAGDASNRTYQRLVRNDRPAAAVLMNAPPDKNSNTEAFVRIDHSLRKLGLNAPELFADDMDNGFLLMEDFGDDLLTHICRTQPKQEIPAYSLAIDVLATLQSQQPIAAIPSYSDAIIRREVQQLVDWYVPAAGGGDVTEHEGSEFLKLVEYACNSLTENISVTVLVDYHAENLCWLPDRQGLLRLGLLDFQDARLGHPAYDLVSLLEDARRDVSPSVRKAMVRRYLDHTGYNEEGFHAAFHTWGAQRNLKILGLFTRLCVQEGKSNYIRHIPRVWSHLMRDLSHPYLNTLKRWVERNVPEPTPFVLEQLRRKQDAA